MNPFAGLAVAWILLLALAWCIEHPSWFVYYKGDRIGSPFFLKFHQSGDMWAFVLPMFWRINWWKWRRREGRYDWNPHEFIVTFRCWYILFGFPYWFHFERDTHCINEIGRQRGRAYRQFYCFTGIWKHRRRHDRIMIPIGPQVKLPTEFEKWADKRSIELYAEEIA